MPQQTLFGGTVKEVAHPGVHSDELDAPEGDEDYRTETDEEDDINELQETLLEFLSDGDWTHYDSIKQYLESSGDVDDDLLQEELEALVKMEKIRKKDNAYQIIETCDECGQEHIEKDQKFTIEKDNDDVHEESIASGSKFSFQQVKDTGSEKGYQCISIQLNEKIDESIVSFSESCVMPDNMLGSSWGGGGACQIKDLPAHFDRLMEIKKQELTQPFTTKRWEKKDSKDSNEQTPADYYRYIPANRYFITIPDKLVKILKEEHSFDFEKWYEEYKALPENLPTKEYDELAKKAAKIRTEGEILDNVLSHAHWTIKSIAESKCTEFLGIKTSELNSRLLKEGRKLLKLRKELGDIEDQLPRFYYAMPGENGLGRSMKGRREWGPTLDRIGLTKKDGTVIVANLGDIDA